MNHKAIITFLIVIIVILTGAAVYFATNQTEPLPQSRSQKETQITTSENTIHSSEKPATQAESMNWQTYTENTIGFSIQYPSGWPVREPSPSDCGDNKICEITFGNLPQKPDDTVAVQNLVNILAHSPGAIKANGGDGYSNCERIKEITLSNGLNAETKECINDMDGSRQYFYTFKKNGWWYQIVSRKGSEATRVFDDIANSFRFTR